MADYDKHLEQEARDLSESEFRERYCVPDKSPAQVAGEVNAYIESGHHEHRYKMMVIREQDILTILNFHRKQPDCICLPAVGQLPADAIVTAVTDSICHRGFLCRVWSSEFDIVPDGEQVPMMAPPFFQVERMADYRLAPVDPEPNWEAWANAAIGYRPATIMPDNPPNAIPAECQQFPQADPFEGLSVGTLKMLQGYAVDKSANNRYELPQTEHDKMTDFFFQGE